MAICTQCGEPQPDHTMSCGLCDGCHWDTFIPAGYEGDEQYCFDAFWGHLNATCRPNIGIQFMDGGITTADSVTRLPPKIDERVRLIIQYCGLGYTQQQAASMGGMTLRTFQRSLCRLRMYCQNNGAKPQPECHK